ncbi:hypothetical protein I6A81_02655, partial [Frankia sp. CN7]|nr:hypothetical protein [Frankia nepalensis]
ENVDAAPFRTAERAAAERVTADDADSLGDEPTENVDAASFRAAATAPRPEPAPASEDLDEDRTARFPEVAARDGVLSGEDRAAVSEDVALPSGADDADRASVVDDMAVASSGPAGGEPTSEDADVTALVDVGALKAAVDGPPTLALGDNAGPGRPGQAADGNADTPVSEPPAPDEAQASAASEAATRAGAASPGASVADLAAEPTITNEQPAVADEPTLAAEPTITNEQPAVADEPTVAGEPALASDVAVPTGSTEPDGAGTAAGAGPTPPEAAGDAKTGDAKTGDGEADDDADDEIRYETARLLIPIELADQPGNYNLRNWIDLLRSGSFGQTPAGRTTIAIAAAVLVLLVGGFALLTVGSGDGEGSAADKGFSVVGAARTTSPAQAPTPALVPTLPPPPAVTTPPATRAPAPPTRRTTRAPRPTPTQAPAPPASPSAPGPTQSQTQTQPQTLPACYTQFPLIASWLDQMGGC